TYTAQHVNQTRRMIDFLADAHTLVGEVHGFSEAADCGETLDEMAAANHRQHRRSAKAFPAMFRAEVFQSLSQGLDRLSILAGFVISRAQVVVRYRARSEIVLHGAEAKGALADLDGPLRVTGQAVITVQKIQHPGKAWFIIELLRQCFRGVQVCRDTL